MLQSVRGWRREFFQRDRSFIWFRHCDSSVAVGTALTSGPPHRSVREGLPHTAPTSGSCDGQPLVGIRMQYQPPPPIPSCRLSYAPQPL